MDGSVIDADASRARKVPGDRLPEDWSDRGGVTRPVREYLEALDAAEPRARDEPKHGSPKHLSPTDPAAAWTIKGGPGRFGYETNYLIDTANAVIMDVEASPARLSQEIVATRIMLDRSHDRLGWRPGAPGGRRRLRHWRVPELVDRPRRRTAHPGARPQAPDRRQADPRRLRLRCQSATASSAQKAKP